MMIAKSGVAFLPDIGSWVSRAKNKFTGPIVSAHGAGANPDPALATEPDDTASMDQRRYKRLLDHELDRQLLTEVEREDADILDRVRAALYND